MIPVASTHEITPTAMTFSFRKIALGVLVVVLLFFVVNALTLRVVVDGNSMSPTVEAGDFLLVNRRFGDQHTFQRGALVVFRTLDNPAQDYVKRIIGLPGEVVELRGQRVYINGQPLAEPYVVSDCDPARCADGIWQVGGDQYFVMGDNRSFSRDSRAFGPIQSGWIVGQVIVRYWPFSQ